jgi:hypothetical protein
MIFALRAEISGGQFAGTGAEPSFMSVDIVPGRSDANRPLLP